MAETAKKISMIPAKVQYDRNVKLSEKKMKVAAYCRVSTELEEQDSSYEAQVEYYTSKISEYKMSRPNVQKILYKNVQLVCLS